MAYGRTRKSFRNRRVYRRYKPRKKFSYKTRPRARIYSTAKIANVLRKTGSAVNAAATIRELQAEIKALKGK